MTIYTKPRAELFAQDAPPSEIKPFTAWLRGLGIAFDETNGFPEMESFNGLLQALNGYIKYLEQNGFSEWSSDLEYPIGAGVRVGAVWYRAKTQNLNKPPATSQTQWAVFLNANDLSFSDPLQVMNGVVGIKDATTTQKGVARFATATEVANKTNASVAINPRAVVDMFVSQSNTEILPSGRIFKWGKTILIPDEGELIVDFPNGAFPNACYVVQLTENVKTTWANNASHVCAINQSRTGFTIYFNSTLSISTSVDWFAIGY